MQKKLVKNVIAQAFLLFFALVFIIPFLWMLSTSLKSSQDVFKLPIQWIPNPVKWSNYIEAVTRIPFARYFINTVIISVVPAFFTVISSSLVAYSFAKIPWKNRNILFGIVLATMMLPYQVTMIPMYVIWTKLDLVNSFWPLILPSFFGSAYHIFLLRQFFKGIPDSIIDSARIDSAGELRILFTIVMPSSKPVLMTVAMFSFMAGWNELLRPMIYLQNSELFTLAIGLQAFMFEKKQQWEILMAASTLFTLPMIIFFFLGQKQFVEGIVMTGVKE